MGGGLVGLATGLDLARKNPELSITVWEKEASPGQHQSTHNSGVLHAGLYYRPHSLKAVLAVTGIRQMVEFCAENAIPHEICGKLVIATNAAEVNRLRDLETRGRLNGLQGLRWIDGEQIPEIEPHARGLAALHVPQEGIVDYAAVIRCLVRKFSAAGGKLVLSAQVRGARLSGEEWRVDTAQGEFACDYVINCAGLQCDRVADQMGSPAATRIIPFRGQYFELRPESRHLVRNLIYPVPDSTFPFLGVHFTRLIHGGIEAGPNAVLAFAREGYSKWKINPRDLYESLTFPGLRRFLWQHRRMCTEEFIRAYSSGAFCAALQKLVPAITLSDLQGGSAGVRAQAMEPNGTLVQDFMILDRPRALHVLNAPSPAATASLAIGSHIADRFRERMSS